MIKEEVNWRKSSPLEYGGFGLNSKILIIKKYGVFLIASWELLRILNFCV